MNDPVMELDERLGCYLCTFYDADMKNDERTATYTVNGVAIIVGVGKGGRVVAFTKDHRPVNTPEDFEFRRALWRWIEDTVPFERRVLHLIEFGDLRKMSSAHTAEWRLYPPVLTVSSLGIPATDRLYKPDNKHTHPHLFSNVFELQHHFELPIHVVDEYVHAAQEFVGYFYGKHVTSGQMANILPSDRGDRDTSVVLTEMDWVEPFDVWDDCPLCERMTDRSIEERVAGFQWEMDKEAQSRAAQHGGPSHSAWDASPEGREEYHKALAQHLQEFPTNFRPFPLIWLPHRLKQLLCLKWNHIIRDWLSSDPRYGYAEGHYFVIWTERIGGYNHRPTRSDSYGSGGTIGYYAAMAASFYGIHTGSPDPPPAEPIEPDELNIWLGED